jgi:predicted nucleic acid-binding protein
MAVYTLDTSAVLAVLKRERDYDKVADLLRSARDNRDVRVLVPFVAMMEVQYKLLRELPKSDVAYWLDVVRAWPVEVIESNPVWGAEAARVKATSRVSLADAWVASLALLEDAELLHKDPEFEDVSGLKMIKLAYDRDMKGSN